MIGFVTQIFAFRYTLLASVTLLNVVGIIVAALLSQCLFKLRYVLNHYVGIVICIAGVITTIWSDLIDERGNFNLGTFWRDLLAIISALSYAVSTILTEFLFREGSSKTAILAYLGFFGFIFSTIAFLSTLEF